MQYVSNILDSLNIQIAGFCENSLSHVERLNLEELSHMHSSFNSDTTEWEEIASVKLPRTKFCAV